MRRFLTVFSLLFAMSLVAAACGDSDTDSSADGDDATTEDAGGDSTDSDSDAGSDAGSDSDSDSDADTGGDDAAGGGVLRIGQNSSDLASLDPDFATTTESVALVDMIYNGLLRFAPGDGTQIEPDLAEALPTMEIVGGAQEWTFTLRQGVMCHPSSQTDAYELTSADVVASFAKSSDPDRSSWSGDYTGITFEAVDDFTVKAVLETPLSEALFLPKVANYHGGFIVCSQALDAIGDEDFKLNPVGTGPFMFESYSPAQSVTLVANETYFRGRPKLDGIDYRYMPDLNARESALLAGDLDVMFGQLDSVWVEQMSSNDGVTVDVFGVGESAVLHFNTNVAPLDDPEVRKALAYALDRNEFQVIFGAPVADNIYSASAAQFLSGGLDQSEAEAADLAYDVDLDRARQMLTDAGYPEGFSLDLVTSERPSYRVIYENMQSQLSAVGVEINLTVVDHSTMHAQIREDVNPIVVYVSFRPNSDVVLTNFFHSDSIVVTGPNPNTNFSHYSAIDGLIEEARASTDTATQESLWKDAQTTILTDMVAYPLHFQNQVYARTDAVDYGHELKAVLALYPGIDENTTVSG